jgi:hypothetical protein
MAWQLAAQLAIVGGIALYQRLTRKDPPPPPPRQFELPKNQEGGSVPIVFGRVRVQQPALVYFPGGTFTTTWSKEMQYVIGIPFYEGTHRFHRVFFSDVWSDDFDEAPNTNVTFGPLPPVFAFFGAESLGVHMTSVLFYGGGELQDLSAFLGEGRNYRGYLFARCVVGSTSPSIPDFDFEISTYPTDIYYSGDGWSRIGQDANPVDIIASLLCDPFAKHGLDRDDVIDSVSFSQAAYTLYREGLGMSISWEERRTTREMIDDVLVHIDAAFWFEPSDEKWHIKLIRGDYDYASLSELGQHNCTVTDFTTATVDGLPNAVRIEYEERDLGYQTVAIVAEDLAAAVRQDGDRIEVIKRFPGCKTNAIAKKIAARELSWDGSPSIKCRVTAGRQFQTARPGDVFKLTYPDLQIAGKAMRVVEVSLGLATDNTVMLDLVEDVFSIYRRTVNPFLGTVANPGGGVLLAE